MKTRFSVVLFLFFSLPFLIAADFPKPAGFVNDFAGIIAPETKASLETTLGDFEKASGIEIAVVTLPTLMDRTIEDAAVHLFQEWVIGKKGKDNGLLFLVAPNERKMRIEVGYGLEGIITDAKAGRVRDALILPAFRAGDMNGGIERGTLALIKMVAAAMGLAPHAGPLDDQAREHPRPDDRASALPLGHRLFIIVVVGIIFLGIALQFISLILSIFGIKPRWLQSGIGGFIGGNSGGLGGPGGFGGFGGFGGGCSGGGGASGGW